MVKVWFAATRQFSGICSIRRKEPVSEPPFQPEKPEFCRATDAVAAGLRHDHRNGTACDELQSFALQIIERRDFDIQQNTIQDHRITVRE
ncbi:hypothetical protein [Allorhizobium sonneratiae]|uniref:hypothetical protein n=1 Tax=Allorhizobium sonneratiae TaxID=2934936 RepID=UPI002034835E|nr:hypothetical protein [Allorhizobium sonneratiae]